MIWSAYMGLPLSLAGVGAVLGLEEQKLTEGKDLIRYFCVPCKPTKVNGGRTRNLPVHDKAKWEMFKKYNKRDVEVEMSIQEKLAKFPVPEFVWEEYHLDQEINDRGIALDMAVVENAIIFDERSKSLLSEKMQELTGLDNPNYAQQMKGWLSENGLEMESLGKKEVAEVLNTAPEPLKTVLSLRQQLAKSSVKKYQAMENAVCKDGRARGMFQFYGANRSGRWAGRLIQLQNLPQNHISDLAEARSLVKVGDYDAMTMLYDDVPDTLSQLIRTAFVPRPGMKFIVSDFSAIEARVLSHLAGETWRADVFASGGDIYCTFSKSDVSCACGKTWSKRTLKAKRQNCRTGTWIWWLCGCIEIYGSTADGAGGRGTAAACRYVEVCKSEYRKVLVGSRPCREKSSKGKTIFKDWQYQLFLQKRHAFYWTAKRQNTFLCEAKNGYTRTHQPEEESLLSRAVSFPSVHKWHQEILSYHIQ